MGKLTLLKIADPTCEPLSISALKDHSRIEVDTDDQYIAALLKAARQQLEETECWIQLITATYELQIDEFPGLDEVIKLPKPPYQSLDYIKYVATDGTLTTLADNTVSPVVSSSVYTIDPKWNNTANQPPAPAEIFLAYNQTWPSTRVEKNAVRIRYKAGFGADGKSVPETLKQWLLMTAGTMYDCRETVVSGNIVSKMQFVDGLLDPYRVKRFA